MKTKFTALFLLVLAVCSASAKPKYISPNSDGVQDELVIPLHISEKRFVQAWSLVIMDSNKKVIRVIENKVALPEKLGFKSFFKQLVTPKQGVVVPESIVWNGAMNNGETAPDGTYFYYVTATDDNGNVGKTKEYEVIVDTVSPQINLNQPSDKTFGEGAKSSLKISQSGSKEDKWTGTFKNADGQIVKTYIWENSEPLSFNWFGTNQDETQVPDGVYTYEITATDKAGNTAESTNITNIIYSADKPSTNIYVDGTKYFAPGTSSANQKVNFAVSIPVPDPRTGNKLTEWSVTIYDANKKTVVKEYNQKSNGPNPPALIEFDGKDSKGNLLPNGDYQASITAKYLNGYVPAKINSPIVVLDTIKPDAQIRAANKVFGGKDLPEVKFSIGITAESGAPVESWVAEVKSADSGKTVKTFDLGAFPPETLSWNGIDDNGKIADKGDYVLVLSAKDLAGNIGGGKSADTVTFDTTEATILLSMNSNAFSPNSDKVQDTISFTPVTETRDVTKYTFEIYNAKGQNVYSKQENKKLPVSFVWDGKKQDGIRCEDGVYFARLSINTANGNSALTQTGNFELDTKFPSVTAQVPYDYFSPDGDKVQDTIPVTLKDSTNEKKWTAEVRNSKDKTVKTYSWSGSQPSFTWDGTNNSGNPCDNGKYSILIYSTDEAGNAFSTEIKNITLDNRETKIYITVEHEGISPNNDKVLDSQIFNIQATVKEGIESWNFNIKNEKGSVVYSLSNKDSENLPSQITWNGIDNNKKVCEGTFFATLDAVYKKGNKVNTYSSPFVCTASKPALKVTTAPQYFSPDNDGVDDDLFIKLEASTKARIKSWSFEIYDPKGKKFWVTSGKEQLSEKLIWDGLSNIQKSKGVAERVQSAMDYPYKFTVTDNLGMTSSVEGIIPIDILVIREGNILKMAVPSIIFESNAANFQKANSNLSDAQVRKNIEILNRIAEILKKFPNYSISIEGHANRVSDNENEETTDNMSEWGRALVPLSKERAEGIKAYLIKRGVPEANISTQGIGGTKPVVNPKDKDNNWKNRRVEFILVK